MSKIVFFLFLTSIERSRPWKSPSECAYLAPDRTLADLLGARILAMLIDLLIHLVKNVLIAFGWFGLILALVEIYSKLKELKIALDEKEAFLAVA